MAIACALFLLSGCERATSQEEPSPPPQNDEAPPAQHEALSEEDERLVRQEIELDCMSCHSEEMLMQQRLTREQWSRTVHKMQRWGVGIALDRVDQVITYLAQHYGPDAPPITPRVISAEAAQEALAQEPDGPYAGGNVERGDKLFGRLCLDCHGPDGLGTRMCIRIADRPILYRAPAFAEQVKKGKHRMPGFGGLVSDADIADLLAYLRTLRPSAK